MGDFTAALLAAIEQAQTECGIRQPRLQKSAETYGGVSAAKEYMKHNRASDGFDALAKCGRLELSMEALVVSSAWHSNFTDDEVNFCFSLLCGENFDRF